MQYPSILGTHLQYLECLLLGELADGRVMDGEGRVAGDAEKGGVRLFGGRLAREEVGE